MSKVKSGSRGAKKGEFTPLNIVVRYTYQYHHEIKIGLTNIAKIDKSKVFLSLNLCIGRLRSRSSKLKTYRYFIYSIFLIFTLIEEEKE